MSVILGFDMLTWSLSRYILHGYISTYVCPQRQHVELIQGKVKIDLIQTMVFIFQPNTLLRYWTTVTERQCKNYLISPFFSGVVSFKWKVTTSNCFLAIKSNPIHLILLCKIIYRYDAKILVFWFVANKSHWLQSPTCIRVKKGIDTLFCHIVLRLNLTLQVQLIA